MNRAKWLPGSPLPRRVSAEALDDLLVSDPRAVRSRHDLYRINRIMRTRSLVVRALSALPGRTPQRIVELGCGDGQVMLDIARCLSRRWPAVHLTLVDRQPLVAPHTVQAFADLGWNVHCVTEDVMDWVRLPDGPPFDLMVCNLFIHHFEGPHLSGLLSGLSLRTRVFFACEPHRARLPLICSHLVGLIGANAVTRSDAVLSVHAGFRDHELSAVWMQSSSFHWRLKEYSLGLFSHCFLALQESQ